MARDPFAFFDSLADAATTADKKEAEQTTPRTKEKAVERKTEQVLDESPISTPVHIATLNMQDNYKRAADVYAKYQDNIRAASNLRSELLLGAKAGRNPYDLLLLAAECIGAMTGDTTVYAANMAGNIREGYGPDALTAKS
jgi:hypothetical protein